MLIFANSNLFRSSTFLFFAVMLNIGLSCRPVRHLPRILDHDDDAAPDDAVKTWVAQRAAACPAPPPTEPACRLPVFHLHQDLLPGTSVATRAGVLAPNLVHFFSPTLPPWFFSFLRSLFFPIITLRRGGGVGRSP